MTVLYKKQKVRATTRSISEFSSRRLVLKNPELNLLVIRGDPL